MVFKHEASCPYFWYPFIFLYFPFIFFVLHLFYIRLFIILSSNTEKFNYKEDWWYWYWKLAKKTCSSILTTFNTLFSMQFLLEYCRTPSFGGHNHFPRRWLITRLLSIIFLVGWYVSCRTLVNYKSRFCHCSVINRLTRRWLITGLSVIASWSECT